MLSNIFSTSTRKYCYNSLNPFVVRSCFQTKKTNCPKSVPTVLSQSLCSQVMLSNEKAIIEEYEKKGGLNPFVVRSCFQTASSMNRALARELSQSLYSQVMLSNLS